MPKTTATRSSHTKSRGGCARCKRRHVKCDEKRPCGNCVRRNTECSLTISAATSLLLCGPLTPQDSPSSDVGRPNVAGVRGPTPDEPESQAQPPASLARNKSATIRRLLNDLNRELETLDTEQTHPSILQPTQEKPYPGDVTSEEWLQDLHLLQYYCTTAYLDLCNAGPEVEIWRVTLLQVAFSNKALMHGLLAFSALIYGHANPDKREAYQIALTRHQTIAIRAFSEDLQSITEENCPAAFLLSALIFATKTFSISDQYDHGMPISMNDITQTLLLSQGSRSILSTRPAWQWPAQTPMDIYFTPANPDPSPTGPFMSRISDLFALARQITNGPASVDQRSALILAIEGLRHIYGVMRTPGKVSNRVWSWAATIPASFWEMLDQGDAGALAVLAHFVAFVHAGEGMKRHVDGWARAVMDVVTRDLEKGKDGGGEWRTEWADWKRLVKWPLRCVREGIDITNVAEGDVVEARPG